MIFIRYLHILYWILVDIDIRRVSNLLWSARDAWVSSSSLGPTADLFKPIWIHTCFSCAIQLFSQVPRLRPISASYLPIVLLIRIDFLKLWISLKLGFLSLRSPSGIQWCRTRKMAGGSPLLNHAVNTHVPRSCPHLWTHGLLCKAVESLGTLCGSITDALLPSLSTFLICDRRVTHIRGLSILRHRWLLLSWLLPRIKRLAKDSSKVHLSIQFRSHLLAPQVFDTMPVASVGTKPDKIPDNRDSIFTQEELNRSWGTGELFLTLILSKCDHG